MDHGRTLLKINYEYRNSISMKEIAREILLGLWKVHILHHAAEKPVIGFWMMQELRRHGYDVSPGTLYPLLKRMERHGWLSSKHVQGAGLHAPRGYSLTPKGRKVLKLVRKQVAELWRELNEHAEG